MKFKIHRGTKEIGGSCVEVWTETTRILLDFGMPLVERDGKEFDFSKYKILTSKELVDKGILPDIKGLYDSSDCLIDGVIISHPHQDHYGLVNYINHDVQYYLGEATHEIIELNNLFTPQEIELKNTNYFEKSKTFKIDDISITPYCADHSAFDAYSFLVEANGKAYLLFGRFSWAWQKRKAFDWFTYNAPKYVDYLLLEGTTISRENKLFKTEQEIEAELTEIFQQKGKINMVYTSGQNIDRLTSIYRACKRTKKIFVVDIYVAKVLKELSQFASIPYPSAEFENLRVMFPYFTSRKLKNEGNENVLYQFKKYKITKEEISELSDNIVMTVRPSMQKDLEKINGIENGNFIYSMWEGYFKKPDVQNFVAFLKQRNYSVYQVHTSGHADIKTLKRMVRAINPKVIVPIHTFEKERYKDIFSKPVLELKDGEIKEV